ncbi:MAG: twin-arginine translocase subunit TatB [Alphaproteobacteria bacterium]|nr:MAG: twin-arginine translocase subunit TatB [Alphaproteobacteria bacterium]
MFDIGMIEMFVIVVLAVIVVGPKDLPRLVRSIGRFVSKIRAMGQEFQSSIKQMADEVELEEVTRKLNEAVNIPLDDTDIKPDIKPDPAGKTGADEK